MKKEMAWAMKQAGAMTAGMETTIMGRKTRIWTEAMEKETIGILTMMVNVVVFGHIKATVCWEETRDVEQWSRSLVLTAIHPTWIHTQLSISMSLVPRGLICSHLWNTLSYCILYSLTKKYISVNE